MQPVPASLSSTIKWSSLRAWGCADRRFRGWKPDRRRVSRVIDNRRSCSSCRNYIYTLLRMVSRDRQTLYDRSVMMCCTTQQQRPGCGNGVAQFHVTHGVCVSLSSGDPSLVGSVLLHSSSHSALSLAVVTWKRKSSRRLLRQLEARHGVIV